MPHRASSVPTEDRAATILRPPGESVKYLLWLLKAAIFFALFAFALNNQDPVLLRLFGAQWQAPLVLLWLSPNARPEAETWGLASSRTAMMCLTPCVRPTHGRPRTVSPTCCLRVGPLTG